MPQEENDHDENNIEGAEPKGRTNRQGREQTFRNLIDNGSSAAGRHI